MNKKMMKRMFIFSLVFLLALIPNVNGAKSSSVSISKQVSFGDMINKVLENKRLKGAITGISVRSSDSGKIIYEHNGNIRLRPASNMKLLTAAAALYSLGVDYKFKTEVLTDGILEGNVLKGNVYLKGKGDPTLLEEDINKLAKDVREKGIKAITGNVVADDSWYDDVRYSMDLPWSDETEYYGAQISALTVSPNKDYDAGTVIVDVYPSKQVGKPALIKVTPENDYVHISNKVKTVGESEKKKITINREHGTNEIIVNGTIPINQKYDRNWVAIWEPTEMVRDLFTRELKKNGIKIEGNSIAQRGKAPKNSLTITKKESMPLSDLLVPIMKLSNNVHAETLVKEMGKIVYGEGSWEKGLKVVNDAMPAFGVNQKTLLLRDGSGISHANLIPANEISRLLYNVQSQEWFPVFKKSLPIAGEKERFIGGTLRNRMKNTSAAGHVMAKTGSITGVNAISGYVTTKSGKELMFSIILNNLVDENIEDIEDEIVNILVNL